MAVVVDVECGGGDGGVHGVETGWRACDGDVAASASWAGAQAQVGQVGGAIMEGSSPTADGRDTPRTSSST